MPCSDLDTTGIGIRDTQILHLSQGAADGGGDAQGSQGFTRMGLEHRQAPEDDGVLRIAHGVSHETFSKHVTRGMR